MVAGGRKKKKNKNKKQQQHIDEDGSSMDFQEILQQCRPLTLLGSP